MSSDTPNIYRTTKSLKYFTKDVSVNIAFTNYFYRATHTHRTVYAVVCCPPVPLSVYCVETTELVIKLETYTDTKHETYIFRRFLIEAIK